MTIRPATADDQATIRAIVRQSGLPPFSIRWPHFLVAEQGGEIVGVGQIRWHGSVPELGSLAVRSDHRGQGIGGQLIAALEARAGLPLYLYCRAELEPYYTRYGYQRIGWDAVPGPLRLQSAAAATMRLFRVRVLLMVKKES
jgi:N-acetylglutamate synthase-like GNAT family acetyltransferase